MDADTLKRLAEGVLELDGKATKGPWRIEPQASRFVQALKQKSVAELPCGGVFHAKVDEANARFIAHARTSAPQLARAVLKLLPFVEHKYGCHALAPKTATHSEYWNACTCGLDAALKEIGA